jgi:hypothetical protein
MLSRLTVIVAFLVLLSSAAAGPTGTAAKEAGAEAHLLILQNARVVVGILPEAGGRIVLLRRPDGENVLGTDPTRWDTTRHPVPEPDAMAPAGLPSYNGHVTWLGPQAEWWARQNVNPKRRRRKANWPPDPWWLYGRFRVVEQSDSSVTLRGPDSPVTGVRLSRTVSIAGNGEVTHRTDVTNIRDEPQSWDVWSNTRFLQPAVVYIPTPGARDPADGTSEGLSCARVAPFTVLSTEGAVPAGRNRALCRAGLDPRRGVAIVFTRGGLVVKSFQAVAREQVAPGHSPVELFALLRRGEKPMLEVEFHGPYRRIDPGKSISFTETFLVLPYEGPDSRDAQLDRLNSLARITQQSKGRPPAHDTPEQEPRQ